MCFAWHRLLLCDAGFRIYISTATVSHPVISTFQLPGLRILLSPPVNSLLQRKTFLTQAHHTFLAT